MLFESSLTTIKHFKINMNVATKTKKELERAEFEAWIDDNIVALSENIPPNLEGTLLTQYYKLQYQKWLDSFKKQKKSLPLMGESLN